MKTPREKINFWKNVSSKVGTEDLHTQIASQHLTRQLIFPTTATPRMDFYKYFPH